MSASGFSPWFQVEIYNPHPLVNGWRGIQTFRTKRAAYAAAKRLQADMAEQIANGWAVDVFCVPPSAQA